ncbi:hypothetical protein ACIHIX_13495 [Streptomyces sp. NPDC051913]|uniref:hypothetical protein n=1 Tax=Streptomyces sp. NPDC051913 TaxID=3365676 RepID=UPI0037D38E59
MYAVVGGGVDGRAGSLSAHREGAAPAVRTRWAWKWRGFGTGPAGGVTHGAHLARHAVPLAGGGETDGEAMGRPPVEDAQRLVARAWPSAVPRPRP